jgi:hypothetical protein
MYVPHISNAEVVQDQAANRHIYMYRYGHIYSLYQDTLDTVMSTWIYMCACIYIHINM